MHRYRTLAAVFTLVAAMGLFALRATAADASSIAGIWTTSFDSPVGVQTYTFTFKVAGAVLTGQAKSENGDNPIVEGKVEKDTVTFVENMDYQGQALRIVYAGTVVSADEIKFKRDVGGQGGEEFTAKRQK
jgi:hypothetical protein